jgi:hypothetical protein
MERQAREEENQHYHIIKTSHKAAVRPLNTLHQLWVPAYTEKPSPLPSPQSARLKTRSVTSVAFYTLRILQKDQKTSKIRGLTACPGNSCATHSLGLESKIRPRPKSTEITLDPLTSKRRKNAHLRNVYFSAKRVWEKAGGFEGRRNTTHAKNLVEDPLDAVRAVRHPSFSTPGSGARGRRSIIGKSRIRFF